MIDRQKLVGWILVVVSAAYIGYFLRERLFAAGPVLESKEWVRLVGSIVVFMVGTANVRLAAMRHRKRSGLPE